MQGIFKTCFSSTDSGKKSVGYGQIPTPAELCKVQLPNQGYNSAITEIAVFRGGVMSKKPKKTHDNKNTCKQVTDGERKTSTVGLMQIARIYKTAGQSIVLSDQSKKSQTIYGASSYRVR